jgi:hypothetical protein
MGWILFFSIVIILWFIFSKIQHEENEIQKWHRERNKQNKRPRTKAKTRTDVIWDKWL